MNYPFDKAGGGEFPSKLSPIKTNAGNQGVSESDEPYPSLSDFHDYEPNLEFDDTELHQPPDANTVELIQEFESTRIESPVSDFTDDDFEEQLSQAPKIHLGIDSLTYPAVDDDNGPCDLYEDIANLGIVDVVGDDTLGRRVIVVYASKLPNNKEMNHTRFLQYLKFTLDKYVEQDYSLVYFHYGLSSKNKPPLSWLWQAYRAFDRKYKKNLKALYLVHPTNFLRIISQLFRPAISVKFGKKIMYINYLQELKEHLHLDQLSIPQSVIDHDDQLTAKSNADQLDTKTQRAPSLPTHQFGVTLQFIKKNNNGAIIPPIVEQCVEYLDRPEALETEGIFRRSANTVLVREFQTNINLGHEVVFEDPHVAAVLLKTFLRELREPLLTFELYEEVMQFQTWNKDERLKKVSILILERLPEDNYKLLKYIMKFLSRVMDRSDLNKMTAQNLAVVFGPNLIWPEKEQMSLSAIGPINVFTQFLLQNQDAIFIV